MSGKSKRFDKYKIIFNTPDVNDNDDRITLLLGEIEDLANRARKRAGRAHYDSRDVVITEVTPGMRNGNFTEKTAGNDIAMHKEWVMYLLWLGSMLAQSTIALETGTGAAAVAKNAITNKRLDAIKALQNRDGSTDQLVLAVLSRIAAFTTGGAGGAGGNHFLNNHSQLGRLVSVQFRGDNGPLAPVAQAAIVRNGNPDITSVREFLTDDAAGVGLITGTLLQGAPLAAFANDVELQDGLIYTLGYSIASDFWLTAPAAPANFPVRNALVPVPGGHIVNANAQRDILLLVKPADAIAARNPAWLNEWSAKVMTLSGADAGGARFAGNDEIFLHVLNHMRLFARSQPCIFNKFNYNIDKYIRNKLFDPEGELIPVATQASSFFNEEVEQVRHYFRDTAGRLVTIDPSTGKTKYVDLESDAFKALLVRDKCMGTGFIEDSSANGKKCVDYLRDCLSGKDIQQCKEYLKDDKYWDKIQVEVDQMLPPIAVKTLQSFEFQTTNDYDEQTKTSFVKMSTVGEWLRLLNGKIDPNDYNAISKNAKLLGYLELLVAKVNGNRAILNPSYKDQKPNTNSFRTMSHPALNGIPFAQAGIPFAQASRRLRGGGSVESAKPFSVSDIERLAVTIRDNQRAFELSGHVNKQAFELTGGANDSIARLESVLDEEPKQTWYMLNVGYQSLVDQLSSVNKKISDEDNNKIRELIEQVKSSEIKLTRMLLITEKYKNLLFTHGETDTTDTLSIDHLKRFVDQRNKYFVKVARKQNDLISIIKAIAESVQKPSSSNQNPTARPLYENIGSLNKFKL
jgi:hypothetical protein